MTRGLSGSPSFLKGLGAPDTSTTSTKRKVCGPTEHAWKVV